MRLHIVPPFPSSPRLPSSFSPSFKVLPSAFSLSTAYLSPTMSAKESPSRSIPLLLESHRRNPSIARNKSCISFRTSIICLSGVFFPRRACLRLPILFSPSFWPSLRPHGPLSLYVPIRFISCPAERGQTIISRPWAVQPETPLSV